MKKIYIKPELMTVKLRTNHILAASEKMPVATEEYKEGDRVLGKEGFGGWDDEEPGEY